MHMKEYVVDGVIRVSGSTNQSTSGESLQDNELTVVHDAVIAAEATRRIGEIHAWMLAHPHNPAA
jgi:phosphatidylserine/phosphatidylglycerophosphate/cardiolipin synthase-like enzyme